MAAAPSAIKQPMQPTKAWQPPRAGHFMQPLRARQPVQPVQALKSPSEPDHSKYALTKASSHFEPSSISEKQGRREMAAAVLALLAGATAENQPALAEEAATEVKKGDDRTKLLLPLPAVALGWVGFNINGYANLQLKTWMLLAYAD